MKGPKYIETNLQTLIARRMDYTNHIKQLNSAHCEPRLSHKVHLRYINSSKLPNKFHFQNNCIIKDKLHLLKESNRNIMKYVRQILNWYQKQLQKNNINREIHQEVEFVQQDQQNLQNQQYHSLKKQDQERFLLRIGD